MDSNDKRLAALRRLLAEAHEKLGLKLGFRLWDGSMVPEAWPQDGLGIAIADPGVLAALLRRPKLDTLLNLHVSDRLAIINGPTSASSARIRSILAQTLALARA